MIRVTIEMLSGGFDNPDGNEILGVMLIDNDLSGTLMRGNYRVRLWKKRNASSVYYDQLGAGRSLNPWATARVEGFSRKSKHVWNLVLDALHEIKSDKALI